MKPIRFEICETNKVLVSHSGLAIAGAALGYTQMKKQFNQIRVPGKSSLIFLIMIAFWQCLLCCVCQKYIVTT